jgi:glyoxylase-like metal-dependent hydrolase (beta-lactamase superfamily II)
VEVFAPGAGHTRDNAVVWLAEQRILFGGCMVKSVTAPDLGYVADAVVADWPVSVRRARDRYSEARIVVPGHGTIHGDSIGATLGLLAKAR